jgi:hypothetical protein
LQALTIFIFLSKEIQLNPQQLEIYNKNFELLVRRIIHNELSDRQLKEAARKVRQFYFGDRPLSQETLLEYVDVSKIWSLTAPPGYNGSCLNQNMFGQTYQSVFLCGRYISKINMHHIRKARDNAASYDCRNFNNLKSVHHQGIEAVDRACKYIFL